MPESAPSGGLRLDLPAVRPEVVPRARLMALHPEPGDARLMLVSAPAGYGKSTFVAQLFDQDPRTVCWLQLHQADNDPLVLLGQVLAVVGRTGPLDPELLEEMAQTVPRVDEIALPLLAADLQGREPFVLVLDDAHLITDDGSKAILEFLVEEMTLGPHKLVLITRGTSPVALGRLRVAGSLVEVGADVLALDAQETRDVAASEGLQLSADEAEALCERTEGWAAAVILAALSLRGQDDGGALAAGLSGEMGEIADYLLEEVLDRQPAHLAEFLLGTSVLERMSAPLCDQVLETTSAAAALEALCRSNAFVVQLDDHREWFRYHHLFRDLLRNELNRRHPELAREYLSRAAAWSEEHGAPAEAFRYAHDCGDLAQAGRIALAHREELSRVGRSESVWLWLEGCSEEEIASDAELAVAAAWTCLFRGEVARAKKFISAAEQGPLDVPAADGAPSLRVSLANVRSLVASDGIPQMLRDGEYVYSVEKEAGTPWIASGCRATGIAHVLLGEPEQAVAPLREALALLKEHPELVHFRVITRGFLAFAADDSSDGRQLQRWAIEAGQLVSEHRLEQTVGGAIAAVALALAHEGRGDQVEAGRQLENARERHSYVPPLAWLQADLALRCGHLCLGLGDPAGAAGFAQQAEDALAGYPNAGALPDRLAGLEHRIELGEVYGLTAAELRLLPYLPTHLSLQEIADHLFLSRSTVKTHVASIYDKLGVPGRSGAVELIEQLGLGTAHPARA